MVTKDEISYTKLAYDEEEAEANFLALNANNTLTQTGYNLAVDDFFGSALTDFSATSDSTLKYTGTETKEFMLNWGAIVEIAESGGSGQSTFRVQLAPHLNGSTLARGMAVVQVVTDNDTLLQTVSRSTPVTLSQNDVITLESNMDIDPNVACSLKRYNIYLTER